VGYTVANSWQGGFTANVTVTNAWNNWAVNWTLPAG
jgi:hypothetical protein